MSRESKSKRDDVSRLSSQSGQAVWEIVILIPVFAFFAVLFLNGFELIQAGSSNQIYARNFIGQLLKNNARYDTRWNDDSGSRGSLVVAVNDPDSPIPGGGEDSSSTKTMSVRKWFAPRYEGMGEDELDEPDQKNPVHLRTAIGICFNDACAR